MLVTKPKYIGRGGKRLDTSVQLHVYFKATGTIVKKNAVYTLKKTKYRFLSYFLPNRIFSFVRNQIISSIITMVLSELYRKYDDNWLWAL